MDAATRLLVRARAQDQCKYCHSRQEDEHFFRFQVEHIIARQHGGSDDKDNLALACPNCNLHKGPNLAGLDPEGGALIPLFHPRRQEWSEHFVQQGPLIVGITPPGRVTVNVLNMNDPLRIEHRLDVTR